jgi:glycyl-tRNA synthetase
MFIVKKKIKGKEYYYLRESKREGAKIKARTIAYLGKDRVQSQIKAMNWKDKIKKPEAQKPIMEKEITIDEIATFCKRKGFVYPSSEIYGGLSGFWDFGHLGTLLKKNFENIWRSYFLGLNDNFYEIEASEIMPEKVFIASGHLKNFNDIAAKCKKGHIERADHLLEKNLGKRFEDLSSEEMLALIQKNKIVCSTCKSAIDYVGPVNMMFPIELGIGTTTKAFLRPETAQSPYLNFKTENEILRNKMPMGLALIGRAYRNELSPRNMLLRQRAFFQAELQIFFDPKKINEHENFDSVKNYKLRVILSDQRDKGIQNISCSELIKRIPKFYVYHMAKVQQFYFDVLNFPEDKFRFYELNEKEKAFYNKYHFDMEADIGNLGWVEMGGVHYRTDHDLKGHQEISNQNLSVYDEESKERFIPHVLELSFGVDRNFQAILMLAYDFDSKRNNIVLRLHPRLAPIKAAVFPIVKKPEYEDLAKNIVKDLKQEFNVIADISGSIGRRYSRNDECGTPVTITVDEQSPKDGTVTARDRDTTEQVRIKIKDLREIMREVVSGKSILKFGKKVNTRIK